MTDRLTDEDLAELERLEKAATPGPWFQGKDMPDGGVCARIHYGKDPYTGKSLGRGDACLIEALPGDDGVFEEAADGALVRAARNALPKLLSELREHRHRARVNAELNQQAEEMGLYEKREITRSGEKHPGAVVDPDD